MIESQVLARNLLALSSRHPELAARPPHASLVRAYEALHGLRGELPEIRDGHIYFHRNEFEGGDPEDRVLAYTRYLPGSGLLTVHNLDPERARRVTCGLAGLGGAGGEAVEAEVVYDTYSFFFGGAASHRAEAVNGVVSVEVQPLQSLMVRLRSAGKR